MGKKLIYGIMSGLLVTLFLTGAAGAEASAAYPVKNTPALTSNDLYDAGSMKAVKCPEGALSTSSTTAAKRTISALWRCMNTAWEAYFKDAGLHFRTGKLLVLTKGRRFCGQKWDSGQAGTYCPESHTAAVLVNKSYLETREIFHFQLVASLYASHVQELTGIGPAFEKLRYHGKSELAEQWRRYNLQGSCLAAVFLGSAWKTAARKAESWSALLTLMRHNGDEGEKLRYYGKGRNIARWLDRGFKSRDPHSCNTWTASTKLVA